MMVNIKPLLLIPVILFVASGASATIINIPADHQTIQAGIDAANDADTVLVQPGNYQENISFDGKNIIVGSFYLTTQDTSYISQTVIDGNQNGSVVRFVDNEDSTAVLTGFTLTNGNGTIVDQYRYGGGIYCNNSSPKVMNITIMGNTGAYCGGGIYCSGLSEVILINVTISENEAELHGGGIYCHTSMPNFVNVTISGNIAGENGGGMYCNGTILNVTNSTIIKNTAENGGGIYCEGTILRFSNGTMKENNSSLNGGGIYSKNSTLFIGSVIIMRNTAGNHGGGMYCENSNPTLTQVTLLNNSASNNGGGLYCDSTSIPVFNTDNRCSIYLNQAGNSGRDLHSDNSSTITVVVDTLTVINPNDLFASPVDNFTFDILHARIKQVADDLYVNPNGDDSNSGQSASSPLRTISTALSIISADSLHPRTIYLSEGIYCPSTNGELFPLTMMSYVSLSGESENEVILKSEDESSVLFFENIHGSTVDNLTISGSLGGSGMYCKYSSPHCENVTVSGNISKTFGGGIYCFNSSPELVNVTIAHNTAGIYGGGLYCMGESRPYLVSVTINENSAVKSGGGIFCDFRSAPRFSDVTISENTAVDGGGIYLDFSSSHFDAVNIIGNSAENRGGGVYCEGSNPILSNVNIKHNMADDGGGIYCDRSNPKISNSIINENSSGGSGGGMTCVYSRPELEQVTVSMNVVNNGLGGGIACNNSDLCLVHVTVSGNLSSDGYGGGISCHKSDPYLSNVIISGNIAKYGGGMYCYVSSPHLDSVTVSENTANVNGGGMFSRNSSTVLEHAIVGRNTAKTHGGGLYCEVSNPKFLNALISNNLAGTYGGGIHFIESNPCISGLTVIRNSALQGGGISFTGQCAPVFESEGRCSIYSNHALFLGKDIFASESPTIAVKLDTFTVINPKDYHVYPLDTFTLEILHAWMDQVDSDLFVSPDGDDTNNGLTPSTPLRTIYSAYSKIIADSVHNNTIVLLNGIYSYPTNGELFPLPMEDYISLAGESEDGVILDAESTNSVLYCNKKKDFDIKNLTIMRGSAEKGGGVYCEQSSLNIENVTLKENHALRFGGGIYCVSSVVNLKHTTVNTNTSDLYGAGIYSDDSDIQLSHVTISENTVSKTGGGIYLYKSYPVLSNVIISKNSAARIGGGMYCYKSDTSLLYGTINDNISREEGGGIYCYKSNPDFDSVTINGNTAVSGGGIYFLLSGSVLEDVDITGNAAEENGGGIYYIQSSSLLRNVSINSNTTENCGGGIYCDEESDLSLSDAIINSNTAKQKGGGIYCQLSSVSMDKVHMSLNSVGEHGGGLCSYKCDPDLSNMMLFDNRAGGDGGGIHSIESNPNISNVTMSRNSALHGGGISFAGQCNPVFDGIHRCNIYSNHAVRTGRDLYSVSPSLITVMVDTFTVINPTDSHISRAENFTIDIVHARYNPVNSDLYVNPNGDDENSGLSPSEPLRTIFCALTTVYADSINPHTIHLSEGIYSHSTNGELFPIVMEHYVSLTGESEEGVILDAEGTSGVIYCYQSKGITIENLSLTGGNAQKGGGVYCVGSGLNMHQVTIKENRASGSGGGLYCVGSDLNLEYVTVSGNTADEYGGGAYCYGTDPTMLHVIICNNTAENGGGVHCNRSRPLLSNVTISKNAADKSGGGIHLSDSDVLLVNTILWNDVPGEFDFDSFFPATATIAYCAIQGGKGGIETYANVTMNWLGRNIEGAEDDDLFFVDAMNGDFHLCEESPCINAGTTFLVFEGDTLVNLSAGEYIGSAPDMGVFEFEGIIDNDREIKPSEFSLSQNYPNPFNTVTVIRYTLPVASPVSINIYNTLGQEIRTLVNTLQSSGLYSVIWDGRDNFGHTVCSGIYVCRLRVGGEMISRKMLLLK